MKICIVTRIDYKNYGNRLQNYAMKVLLDEEHWESVSGLQVYSKKEWEEKSSGLLRTIKHYLPFGLYRKKVQRELKTKEMHLKRDERRNSFVRFTEEHITTLPPLIVRDEHHLYDMLNQYNIDYYVAGSDQVWNPLFGGRDYEFLTFAPYTKRLSFAASFGVSSIPDTQKERFKLRLNGMRYISVREKQGINLVTDLTGRDDVDLAIDPTLLLQINKWEELLEECPNINSNHCIVTFFLGDLPGAAKVYANQKKTPLLKLNCKQEKELYNIGPIEFLSYIHGANCILTDSFHALAFSLKFHREFYVFKRKEKNQMDMFSRLDCLLKDLDLANRIQEREFIVEQEKISNEKWSKIDEYFAEQKELAMSKIRELVTR